MVFKSDWENIDSSTNLVENVIREMVHLACPDKILKDFKSVSFGCANINIKLNFKNETNSQLLRVYLQDKEAAFREQKIGQVLHDTLPAPQIHHIGTLDSFVFALCDFLPGVTLRQYLLNEPKPEIDSIMLEAGRCLASISKQEFRHAGFFDKELNIQKPIKHIDCMDFANECLEDKVVKKILTQDVLNDVKAAIDRLYKYFPDEKSHNLVHGDFGPENILVDGIDGKMYISGILDWEYAFSGSTLHDVANMLRYAHHMPPNFKDSFINGIQSSGVALPEGWEISIKLLNILSLLDCLKRTNPDTQPKRCVDIIALINFNLTTLAEANK